MHYKQITWACVPISSLKPRKPVVAFSLYQANVNSGVCTNISLYFMFMHVYLVPICYCFEQLAIDSQPIVQKAFEKYQHFLVCFGMWHLNSSMGFVQLSNEAAELQRLESKVWSWILALIYTTLLCTILAIQREGGGCKSCPCSQPSLKAAQHSNEQCTCNDGVKGN